MIENPNKDKFEDPKIQKILTIIRAQENIQALINNGRLATAAFQMSVLIQSLEVPTEEKEMETIQEQFTPDLSHRSLENKQLGITDQEIYGLWRKLSGFLNRTYFKGFSSNIRPKEDRPAGKL